MTAPAPSDDQTRARQLATRRRKRNVALALVLGALVIVFYALTIAKMGPAILDRAL